jgi:hypothetical protein
MGETPTPRAIIVDVISQRQNVNLDAILDALEDAGWRLHRSILADLPPPDPELVAFVNQLRQWMRAVPAGEEDATAVRFITKDGWTYIRCNWCDRPVDRVTAPEYGGMCAECARPPTEPVVIGFAVDPRWPGVAVPVELADDGEGE